MNKVYILLLNWNGWKDTIECLESVFRIDYPDYQVILCDNDSRDGSMDHIKAWAEGKLASTVPDHNPLRRFSFPPIAKPIYYVEYNRKQAEAGGHEDDAKARLILIQTGANLGFAGGNNVGLRYALARDDFDYVWLLNNDTVIKPDALTKMIERMMVKPDAGICGSKIPYYHQPDKIWALGGATYNKWGAIPRCIGLSQNADKHYDRWEVESKMDYIAGASMLVSKPFLHHVGLLCEDYFLYFEELDWAVRAKGQYTLAYAPESIVYHKVGASTDTIDKPTEKRPRSIDYMYRNRLLFTRKFYPLALPSVFLRLWFEKLKSACTVNIKKLWKGVRHDR